MAQQHRRAANDDGTDIDPALLRCLEVDVTAAFDFLRAHAEDFPLGRQITEALARQRRRFQRSDRIAG